MPNRYRILHPLEPGPRVSVYLIADRLESRRKVLTLLPFDVSQGEQRLEFEKLYAQRISLRHPSLIRVSDFAFRGGRIGLVSDFLEGPSLDKCRNLPARKRYLAGLQLVELLRYLHKKGFFCGYLEPSQFFVNSAGQLIGNILIPRNGYSPRRQDDRFLRYASPELQGSQGAVPQSDLYSMGMLLYHLFTGVPPYSGDDPDTLARIIHQRRKKRLTEPGFTTKDAVTGCWEVCSAEIGRWEVKNGVFETQHSRRQLRNRVFGPSWAAKWGEVCPRRARRSLAQGMRS